MGIVVAFAEHLEKKKKIIQVSRAFAPGADETHFKEQTRFALLGQSSSVSGIVGRAHPFSPQGTVNISTLDAFKSVVRHLCDGKIVPVPAGKLTTETLAGSAVLLGGPVANLHSRLLFGTGGPSPLLGVELPVSFEYLANIQEALRRRQEKWKLIVDGTSSENEALVITSLPMGVRDRILNIAGLHGAGTRAIEKLFECDRLVERLEKQTKNLVGWQAVFEVLADDNETPRGIGEFKVFEIKNVDFDAFRERARGNLFLSKREVEKLLAMLPAGESFADTPPNELEEEAVQEFRSSPASKLNLEGRREEASGNVILPHRLAEARRAKHHKFNPQLRTGGKHAMLRQGLVDLTQGVSAQLPELGRNINNTSGALTRRSRGRAVRQPHIDEAPMASDPSVPTAEHRRGRGRPPKDVSDAKLIRRLSVLFEAEDVQLIKQIMQRTGATSFGAVVRKAVHAYWRILTRASPKKRA